MNCLKVLSFVFSLILICTPALAGPHPVQCVDLAKVTGTAIYEHKVPGEKVTSVFPILNKSESWDEKDGKAGQESWILEFNVADSNAQNSKPGVGAVLIKISVLQNKCNILSTTWEDL